MLTMMLLVAAQAGQVAPKAEEKIVCRSELEVHSRIPRRVCMTKSERERISRETQEDMKRSGHQRGIAPNEQAIGYKGT